ncbi:MAG: zinc-dependent metalloprotease [Verrucomicrobiota bacterium]
MEAFSNRWARWTGVMALFCVVVMAALPAAGEKGGKKEPAKAAAEASSSEKSPKGGGKGKEEEGDEEKEKTIEEVVKDARRLDGLFRLYEDEKTGKVYLVVRRKDLGKEFIYFRHIVDGVTDVGMFRGAFRGSDIFTIRKHFDRLEFVKENTAFYFDKKNAISRAADANISDAILASQKIVAKDEAKGLYLIDASAIFLTEAFHQVKASPPSKPVSGRFKLGSLSKDKTKFAAVRNYPENTALTVDYVYDNPAPTAGGDDAVTDARYVTIKVQHTLIRTPKDGYRPRFDDPRVGYFTKQVTDLTATDSTPYRDVITRWNLVKKNPGAELSEPVEPIVFWIENTTPKQFRETIRESALLWNEAFESAGFRNAVVIKEQPDDADWDAGDIRYNVMRWTSSPDPPFGGYGPSFIDPRTGQILGADIMLEWVFVTNRVQYDGIFEKAGLSRFGERSGESKDAMMCSCHLGRGLQEGNIFGQQALRAKGAGKEEVNRLMKESLHYLVLHEIGHTLGLMHNMKASQLHGLDAVHRREVTEKMGVTGSVMDYPALNVAPEGVKQGNYYTVSPGPYDHWAIEFGYSEALPKARAERERLETILSRSTEPALTFGNDADDMRSPGGGIDPRVMVGDMSSDAIGYAVARFDLVNGLIGDLLEKHPATGESYHDLRNAYLILTGQYDTQAGVVSRYIGGVYVDRAFVGQEGATEPYRPVPLAEQKRAMEVLDEYVFGPKAFPVDGKLIRHLQQQRRGFEFFGRNEDPRVHERVLEIQTGVLRQLLHSRTLERITDSELYGNAYGLDQVFSDLTGAIMGNDVAKGGWEISSFRRPLQREYVERLIDISGLEGSSGFHADAQALAFLHLQEIHDVYGANRVAESDVVRAHVEQVRHRIGQALEGKRGA